MSVVSAAPDPASDVRGRLPYARWIGLVGIFIAELMTLTLRFDTETLHSASGWWAVWLGQAHLVPRLVVAIAAATLALGGARFHAELRRSAALPARWRRFLLLHLAAFAGFVPLTGFVMEGGAGASACPETWLVAWAGAGLAVVASWCAAMVPPVCWPHLLKRTATPLLLGAVLGVAGWMAGRWAGELWRPFHEGTFWLVRGLLSLSGTDLICEPSQFLLGTTTFAVRIAPECSGYEGMGLISVFLSGYLWLFRRRLRFPAALVLLPVGAAAMWLLNAVRIAVLVLIGSWGSPEVARGGFHSQAGWLVFNGVALALVALSGRLRFLQAAATAKPRTENPTAAYLAPFCAILAVTMLTRAVSNGFDWLYPLRVIAAVAVLWSYRRQYHPTWGRGVGGDGAAFAKAKSPSPPTPLPRSTGGEGPLIASWPAIGLGMLAFLIWIALVPVASNGASDLAAALAELPPGAAILWLFCRVVGAAITVPVAEELAFRGYVLRRLVAVDFEKVDTGRLSLFAFLASSALFAVLHAGWLAGMTAGLIYALAFSRRGRLMDAVLAHATTNAILAGYAIVTGHWSLWG